MRAAQRRWAARMLAVGLAACGARDASAGPYTEAGYVPDLMAAWATGVHELVRGPVDMAEPEPSYASYGDPLWALGPSTGDAFDVVSLGDGGWLTLAFASGIRDGPGDDFAVYENGFQSPGGFFGEFAFVEVSSNGSDFARFPATSLQPEPVSGPDGDTVDPTDYHNLAGKHATGLGTGFDLGTLADHPLVTSGALDLEQVGYVRLVDVIGDGSTQDDAGRPVYDPYPTPYPTGGFDADAVGVLHVAPEPGAAALLASGALCLAGLGRRRRAAARGTCAARG